MSSQPPNVVIIHCDQLRFDGLGCNKAQQAPLTLHIDGLARSGRNYRRHIAANTVCCPSRASLLTGLYPLAHGLLANGQKLARASHQPIPPRLLERQADKESVLGTATPTMADHFQAAGYQTTAIGKLHLQPLLESAETGGPESTAKWRTGELDEWSGPYYGFDEVSLVLTHHENQQIQAGHYGKWIRERDPALVRSIEQDPPKHPRQLWVSPLPSELHPNHFIAETFEGFLQRRSADKPFFAFLGFPGPHHPFAPSPEFLDAISDWKDTGPLDPEGQLLAESQGLAATLELPPETDMRAEAKELLPAVRKHTAAMIRQIDDAVGRILKSLEERGGRENTLIVFTSDHGDYLGDHGLLYKHVAAADCLLHVPFIISGPGVPAGSVDDDPMSNVDTLPTLLSLGGLPAPELCHGIDRSSEGSGKGHIALAQCYGSLNWENFRYLDNYTIYDSDCRMTEYPHRGWQELFDHATDPSETRNRIGENRDKAERLRSKMLASIAQTATPVFSRSAPF